ncbi:MAG: 2-succinyl-5-enolpyruvyl-6-hydroxy-3-cyclohexene-1-carboxylic-acid synthase [Crocinitomicaceae bacterium]|nr:2-succinyl-5-enolpyruvyl-6-hydroxy-3-cyclohexene-1-carboxylic-acid synthase [Crocinitomicaceae bacterium]MBP6032805.1 2-succinyl-5-enolpyruvyl-6-hydroxy-3-cyclohexene-1-carboxylic-acid synthase [Crocinitomicaceae bacterium]
MISSSKIMVQLIVDQLLAYDIRKVVVSPGSRNAPFSIAFDEHPEIETFVVHDERSAGFIALGMAQELGETVALCCTSGSACLNYYPAISEAYYRSIPLLVLTADRPAAWINHGDGQTIVQRDVFKNHILGSLELDEDLFNNQSIETHQQELADLLQFTQSNWKGPVHLNVGLNEPLYQTVEKTTNFGFRTPVPTPSKHIEEGEMGEIISEFNEHKTLVLCGQMESNPRLQQELMKFASFPNVVVLVENTSNIQHERFIHCIDRSLNGFDQNDVSFEPEILVTVGGAVVSKRIKAYLRKANILKHYKLGAEFPEMDTYRCLTKSFPVSADDFFAQVNEHELQANKHNFNGKWKRVDILAKDRALDFVSEFPNLTDLQVFQTIQDLLPEDSILHLANSSVVRYAQLFDPIPGVRFESNRGTSGIDGSTSTALGAAIVNPSKQHMLISGDISFLYDSNALWYEPFPRNFKMIVIQNYGGGIFKIIPGPADSKQRERYFEAKQAKSPASIAQAFGLQTKTLSSLEELTEYLPLFFDPSCETQVLEVQTDDVNNAIDLDRYFEFLRN